jgi:RND superfamily putative drug exporter
MISVFALFATMSGIEYKMLGVGMAAAIAIDATIVRGLLLPAALTLLGDRAWGKRPQAATPAPVSATGELAAPEAESADLATSRR